jgi:CBS-domain-containing membrane protein
MKAKRVIPIHSSPTENYGEQNAKAVSSPITIVLRPGERVSLEPRESQPNASAKNTPVSAIMTKNPFGTDPKKTVEACVAMMSEHRFRHLPVLDDADKVVGMVSMGDLVSDLVKEQAFMLEQFERYVATGTY